MVHVCGGLGFGRAHSSLHNIRKVYVLQSPRMFNQV